MNTKSYYLDNNPTSNASYLTAADSVSLSITGDLTFECWVKFDALPTSGNDMYLITKRGSTAALTSYNFCYKNSGGTYYLSLQLQSGTGAGENYQVVKTLSTGIWYHLAVSWDASASTAKFYVNGVQEGSDVTFSFTSLNDNNTDFVIGGAAYNSDLRLDGYIDDVRVWNVVRTVTEISTNYQKELTGSESGLQGYWKFNDSLLDETSNNNDLVASGTTAYSSDVPFSGAAARTDRFFSMF